MSTRWECSHHITTMCFLCLPLCPPPPPPPPPPSMSSPSCHVDCIVSTGAGLQSSVASCTAGQRHQGETVAIRGRWPSRPHAYAQPSGQIFFNFDFDNCKTWTLKSFRSNAQLMQSYADMYSQPEGVKCDLCVCLQISYMMGHELWKIMAWRLRGVDFDDDVQYNACARASCVKLLMWCMVCCQSMLTHTLGGGLPQSKGGWTPLLLACEEGQLEIVNMILASANSDASTLLDTASPLAVSISCNL